MELFSFKRKIDLTNYILILPTVSVGNVPQLTIDLLIASLNFEKIATLWHPGIVPCVGPDPYTDNGPETCTACELYINPTKKIAALQLRSTLNFRLTTKFFDDLKCKLLELHFGRIVIVTSAFDYELRVIGVNKFFYICNRNADDLMSQLGIQPKEKESNDKFVVNGSGFAVKLFESLCDDFDCTVLIKYVSEGDNRPDAVATLELLGSFLQELGDINVTNLKIPTSWSGVFGGPPPLGIY